MSGEFLVIIIFLCFSFCSLIHIQNIHRISFLCFFFKKNWAWNSHKHTTQAAEERNKEKHKTNNIFVGSIFSSFIYAFFFFRSLYASASNATAAASVWGCLVWRHRALYIFLYLFNVSLQLFSSQKKNFILYIIIFLSFFFVWFLLYPFLLATTS